MRITAILLTAGILSLGSAAGVRAQDAAVVNAKFITVKLDNPHVRVFESVLKPGDKEHMHSHPASLVYVIEGGKVRNHAPDGNTSELTLQTGEALYRDPLTHWAENIGDTTIKLVLVEMKDAAKKP